MAKGPRGERRPADVVSAAVMVGKIATGEVSDTGRNLSAEANRKGGLKGGKARAKSMTPKPARTSCTIWPTAFGSACS